MIKEAAKLILASERPVIYAGGGILKARAAEELRELAELTGIHVVTTLMARGVDPGRPPARRWACPACTATPRRSRRCSAATC